MNLQYQELENTFQYSSYKNTKQPSEQRPPREIEQMQDSSSIRLPLNLRTLWKHVILPARHQTLCHCLYYVSDLRGKMVVVF